MPYATCIMFVLPYINQHLCLTPYILHHISVSALTCLKCVGKFKTLAELCHISLLFFSNIWYVPCLCFFGKPRKIRKTSEIPGDVIFILGAPKIIAWRCECVSQKIYFTFERNCRSRGNSLLRFYVRLVFLSTNTVGIKKGQKLHHSGCLKRKTLSPKTQCRCQMYISVVQRSSLPRQKV